MTNNKIDSEIHIVSHIVTIITMTIFSAVLIVLNVLLNWDKWTIPVMIAGLVICIGVHISGKGTRRARIYCYAVFLIFEIFYYTVNINTLYDSTALIVIMMFIFSLTGERLLVILGSLSGAGGIGFHLLSSAANGELDPKPSDIVRTIWQFVLIFLGALLADRVSAAWFNTEKQYQKKIGDIIDENERANNFLANVSHEIRTPVNAVMGLAAIMEKEEIPDQMRGYVSAITDAGHRVADQIGDIMDYTEIDMRKLSVSGDRYMINSVVNDLISQLRYTEDYGLDLVVDLSPDVPSEMIGDDSKIKKILRHLIMNGFKFTEKGGVNVHIFVKKRDYGVNLILEVTDTGVGMSDGEIEHIYEKFYQSDSGRSRKAGGLGLGIPIVNGFARAMGGFIHIESIPAQGTLIRVSIPQEVSDSMPCITVNNKDGIAAVGFLSFMTTEHPRVKDFYMEMVTHLVKGLGIKFHRVKSRDELERLTVSYNITHLFVGTGEYRENKDYIDSLSEKMNVVVIEDKDFDGTAGKNIALLRKPFYGTQIANFLDQSYVQGNDSDKERMTCPGVRALVVDDEPMNLLVARGIFENYGMNVSTVPGGAEAIALCGARDFDIIFMDHMMPGMDGIEAMKRLRLNAEKVRKNLCIVALTANAISSAKAAFLAEGFDAFLPKPIDLPELERVLKHVLPRSAIVYVPIYESDENGTAAKAETREQAFVHEEINDNTKTREVREVKEVNEMSETANGTAKDLFTALKEYGVDLTEGLRYCQNDEGFYKEILAEYASGADKKTAALDGFVESGDIKNYTIKVHSIKSGSKMIGADELSEKAKALEMAGKANDEDFISANHAGFIAEYSRFMKLINDGLEAEACGGNV